MSTLASQGEIVVGLDIGTTKVCAVVGEIGEDGITILGVGSVPCRGLRKGIVSNIDWTVRSIKEAIEAAGYAPILLVHDEVVTETPDDPGYSAARLNSMLAANPPWAADLPMAAGGFETYRYRKD